MKRSKNSSGAEGERAAARFLEQSGFNIECMNYHSRFGEIDIIAADAQYLLFVEVKTRAVGGIASAREAVTPSKQRKIINTALCYMSSREINIQPRFDVVEVYIKPFGGFNIDRIVHIENAFEMGEGNAIF